MVGGAVFDLTGHLDNLAENSIIYRRHGQKQRDQLGVYLVIEARDGGLG